MTKKALVLTGGGVRGAFQVGALCYLMAERGEQYDIITGTSVGALNGSFLAQYKKGDEYKAILDLRRLWLTIVNKKIRKHWFPLGYIHALWKQSLYNSGPLEELIDKTLDLDKLKSSGVTLRVVATSIDSGESRVFGESDPHIKDAVKASAAFPVFFKPVKIGNEYYVDGGVREIAPLAEAIKQGADHITIINTGPLDLKVVHAANLNAIPIAWRVIDAQGTEILVNDLERFLQTNRMLESKKLTDSTKRIIDYEYIGPDYELTDDPLNFDSREIREMMIEGYDVAKSKFNK